MGGLWKTAPRSHCANSLRTYPRVNFSPNAFKHDQVFHTNMRWLLFEWKWKQMHAPILMSSSCYFIYFDSAKYVVQHKQVFRCFISLYLRNAARPWDSSIYTYSSLSLEWLSLNFPSHSHGNWSAVHVKIKCLTLRKPNISSVLKAIDRWSS